MGAWGRYAGALGLACLTLTTMDAAWAAGQVSEAHSGPRKGAVYEATPEGYAPPANGGSAPAAGALPGNGGGVAPTVSSGDVGSAPREAGAGVEIITGGGSSAGAARVGHLPVLK